LDGIKYERQRVNTPDDDFIDLDWSKVRSQNLVIVLHGLEGNADRAYVRGMIHIFNQNKWDGVGMNFRGCSGETNRQLRSYHSGETEDLDFVIQQIARTENYENILLVGFSLGGNIILKYIGENGEQLNKNIKAAVCFSTPVDLESCTIEINKWDNSLYRWRFLRSLKEKAKEKAEMFPGSFDLAKALKAKDFADFDGAVTAPIHGFRSAKDYWTKSSSKPFLTNIKIPTLLINARDDSFLSELCYPFKEANENPNFFLETPAHGGHVGFVKFGADQAYWSEQKAIAFVNEMLGEGN